MQTQGRWRLTEDREPLGMSVKSFSFFCLAASMICWMVRPAGPASCSTRNATSLLLPGFICFSSSCKSHGSDQGGLPMEYGIHTSPCATALNGVCGGSPTSMVRTGGRRSCSSGCFSRSACSVRFAFFAGDPTAGPAAPAFFLFLVSGELGWSGRAFLLPSFSVDGPACSAAPAGCKPCALGSFFLGRPTAS